MSYYSKRKLKKIDSVRVAIENATGRYCTVEFKTLPYVFDASGMKLGYINYSFEFVPVSA